MRSLTGSSIPNIDSSDLANYPYARFKNDSTPTAADGTELSERTLGDLYQAAIELLRLAGITPSETAEKKADSDIADAILKMQPVAVIRVGWDGDAAVMKVFGGKYLTGYTADFAESSVSGDTAVLCKLTVKKDAVATTENLLVNVTSAFGLGAPSINATHGYNQTPGYTGWYFQNDTAGNIIVGDPDSGAIADLRIRTNLLITVYKV
jgi:hypothetical protein